MRDRTLVVSVMVLVVVACGGDSLEPPGAAYPDARLEVTYTHPEAETVTYVISCTEDSARTEGADLDADAACRALSDLSVMSRLIDGPPQDQACPEMYGGPDTATIEGTIEGAQVSALIDRTDGCGISDWDNLLGDLLPPAVGAQE